MIHVDEEINEKKDPCNLKSKEIKKSIICIMVLEQEFLYKGIKNFFIF